MHRTVRAASRLATDRELAVDMPNGAGAKMTIEKQQ
jgi:hypothetical protein